MQHKSYVLCSPVDRSKEHLSTIDPTFGLKFATNNAQYELLLKATNFKTTTLFDYGGGYDKYSLFSIHFSS